jgi:hypothetical protein
MKLFECQACGQPLYFENTHCESCARTLGYLPREAALSALEPSGGAWRALAAPERLFRFCANAEHDACNWLIDEAQPQRYCVACSHNRTVPDLSNPTNLARWRRIEMAKRRLFYTLMRLGLPLRTRAVDPQGLAFDFLADPDEGPSPRILTGHQDGLITLNIAEADDAERERRRHSMGEPYRTLLGHFRHEVGHYYWTVLVQEAGHLEAFRTVFGDEREDYGEALKRHYASGPRAGWQNEYVSAYAGSHPWEDWAETWAHYLHMFDTLETAAACGLSLRPRRRDEPSLAPLSTDTVAAPGTPFDRLIDSWFPLTYVLNNLNRGLGLADGYPFVLAQPAIAKLRFVHDTITDRA